MRKPVVCVNCKKNTVAELVRNITHAGVSNIFWRCTVCNRNAQGSAKWISHEPVKEFGIDIDTLPINKDDREEVCVICGELGAEYHHWAPWHLFHEEAEKWPGAFLCQKHHMYWHNTVTPNMSGNRRDK